MLNLLPLMKVLGSCWKRMQHVLNECLTPVCSEECAALLALFNLPIPLLTYSPSVAVTRWEGSPLLPCM